MPVQPVQPVQQLYLRYTCQSVTRRVCGTATDRPCNGKVICHVCMLSLSRSACGLGLPSGDCFLRGGRLLYGVLERVFSFSRRLKLLATMGFVKSWWRGLILGFGFRAPWYTISLSNARLKASLVVGFCVGLARLVDAGFEKSPNKMCNYVQQLLLLLLPVLLLPQPFLCNDLTRSTLLSRGAGCCFCCCCWWWWSSWRISCPLSNLCVCVCPRARAPDSSADVFRRERRGDRGASASGLPAVLLAFAVAVPLRRARREVTTSTKLTSLHSYLPVDPLHSSSPNMLHFSQRSS